MLRNLRVKPSDLLYSQGDILKKVANTNTGLDWPSLTFEAALLNEDFHEVTIVTLISHYETLCHEKALNEIPYHEDHQKWYKQINQRAKEIMNSGWVKVRESVRIDNNYKGVVIVNDDYIGDNSVTRALQMIEQSTIPGVTYFSKPVTFTTKEVDMRKSNETEKKDTYNKTHQ